MTFFSPTTLVVGFLLLYLASFILLAIIRIGTGISIQRVGYFSLRRIAYAPREGIQLEIRGLGLSLHRPSFAKPTWVSLRITDLKVTCDTKALERSKHAAHQRDGSISSDHSSDETDVKDTGSGRSSPSRSRSKTWKTLTKVKERIKRVHRQIHWLKMVDVVAANTTIHFTEAGYIQVGYLTMAVDTRRKMVDRGKLFRHKKDPSGEQSPAEWMLNVRNILLAVDGHDPMELVDNIGINIHGLLYKDLEGLRDTSVAIKIGRLHVPYDDLMTLSKKVKQSNSNVSKGDSPELDGKISFADFVEELDRPGTQEDAIVQTVADCKEFASSLLRGIQEFQIALSFFRASRRIQPAVEDQKSMYLNVVTHEIGVDLHRMDPETPAHRMYFQRNDVAHQALLAAISLSVSLDDSSGETDKILYVPMATTTIKTTLPSKTVSLANENDPEERNSNVLFANLVVTSPSVDLEPQHCSRLLDLAQTRASSRRKRNNNNNNNHRLISRLLPKLSIKLSIHEPVLRFVLPITETAGSAPCDYNLLISSISSMSMDIESSHSTEGGLHYSLSSIYRITSHQFYYQTPAGVKHNILTTENMEIKVLLNASPEVCVIASGNMNCFSVHMVNDEVNRGIRQVIEQFQTHVQPKKTMPGDENKPSVLRRIPPWLLRFQFEATGSSFEVAGFDSSVSEINRGIALQLQSWTADYRAQKLEPNRTLPRRRTSTHSTVGDEASFLFPPTSPPRSSRQGQADGRRLAFHVRGLEGFAIESEDYIEPDPFFSMPRFEVALSTHSDPHGPISHINSVIKGVYLEYSLYRYYCLGVAGYVLRDTFMRPAQQGAAPTGDYRLHDFTPKSSAQIPLSPSAKKELVTVDVRATLIQVKASLPSDPPMMVQIYGFTAGRHRWTAPFTRCQLIRLHAEAPKLKGVWARIVSMNNVRLDLREIRRKQGDIMREERSIDLYTDFIRIGVPHHMIMHRIFDNCVNAMKAMKQLNHRFKTGSTEYVLGKEPEPPKKVPKISVRSKALLFELEDDAFEWKLGTIYRAGLMEQRQRIAREDAYHLKLKRVAESDRRASSRLRTRSNYAKSTQERTSEDSKRSKSEDRRPRRSSSEDRGRRGRKYRYDTEGTSCLSSSAQIAADEAWYKLQEHNARTWKLKIDSALKFQDTSMREIRNLFSGADEPPEEADDNEVILAIPNRPGLMSALISDVNLVIDKPTFPLTEYAQFLHKIGKGMPTDMKYSLLIPMGIRLDMGEARVSLRDYPLDLLHIPALRPGQSPRLPSWSLKTNLVIAEEFRDEQSARHVQVEIVPASTMPDGSTNPAFCLDVRRTVSPVKTYSEPTFEINTSLPTSISWGMSYQPVIQDMMKIIEGFTKPEIDPSDRVGFWDKIRMSFHSAISVVWKGDGDVHFRLKGSRDPYVVTGFGAGFVMCWRKDVQWNIHQTDDPREFMSVTSGEYVLAVPDYSHEARSSLESPMDDGDSESSSTDVKNTAFFKKVVMKLSGNVRWLAGLVFERDLDNGVRSFQFKPHYEVVLRNPIYVPESDRQDYDAYKGFRSNHIHLSIAVEAPNTREWVVGSPESSTSYNTVHLTPRFFTHFFNWWSLFSGVMSLPVRQGPLWPGITKTSKKFSRHLATVKYKLLFAPLFVAHIYKHKDQEDYSEDVVTATGIKVRLDSFRLDVHQRREQIRTMMKGRSKQTKASAMRINQTQLDFLRADFRAVSSSIEGTNPEDIQKNTDDVISTFQQPVASIDLSRFTIPDQNMDWIDMDDFVELDWILPQESNPRTQILPLAFAPRFTYLRQTDHGQADSEQTGFSPFGDEPTHECVISQDNDPRRVQMELVKERLAVLERQSAKFDQTLREQEEELREHLDDPEVRAKRDLLIRQAESLARRRKFLGGGLRRLERQLTGQDSVSDFEFGSQNRENPSFRTGENSESMGNGDDPEIAGLYSSPNDDLATDFNNRFIIHNIQLKWNNSLRNIILRYGHQVSQRRGFVYYMSRRAVKFILDIVEEQNKAKKKGPGSFTDTSPSIYEDLNNTEKDDDGSVEDRIEQLLNDAKRYVNADDSETSSRKESRKRTGSADFSDKIAPEFTAQNSYHLRLIAPQIQLQSEKNPKSVALIAAKGMQLKVVSIMDKQRVGDDVSGLIQRRFSLDMDGAQFFVATQKNLIAHLQFYAGNKYGNAPGSAWPPWITLEAMFDFELNPFGFSRIIQKTSASLRYDKYNNLRLKYNEEVGQEGGDEINDDNRETRMDQILVDFPRVRAICDSAEYYSMYIIVLDLLLYSEPLEKVRNERLEKIMLASDFSDLRGAPEMVSKLQERIRRLEEIKEHFQVQAKYLDRQGWEDRMTLERDLTHCEDELFFIMKAITTSQRRNEDRSGSGTNGLLRWNISASEVVWHLMKDPTEPLVEFQLRDATYERTDNSDGSNHNLIKIQRLYGLNLLPDALYPQMIVPYLDQNRRLEGPDSNMLKVEWYMLEAVAGIPVLDDFEVTLFPLKIQLERDTGQKLFEYIFPGVGGNAFENGGFSPFMIPNTNPLDDDSENEQETRESSPTEQSNDNTSGEESQHSTGPGAIQLRLQPTLSFPDQRRQAPRSNRHRGLMMTPLHKDSNRLGPTDGVEAVNRPSTGHSMLKKKSVDSLRMLARQPTNKSASNISASGASEDKEREKERAKKFTLGRANRSKSNAADDISQMMSRASNYMTLAHVKINDVILCLSYKGKGGRNIEDVHDFVFRLPVLEYRNKTWSNLDLALRLKKDVMRALISHAPAILGNKFSHHRPSKQQQKRLRELATSSQVLPNSDSVINPPSDEPRSIASRDSTSELSESPSRKSFNSNASPLARSTSLDSSIQGSHDHSIRGSHEPNIVVSDSRSASEVDVDRHSQHSNSFMHNTLTRHLTSSEFSSREADADEDNESPKKGFRNFGRRLLSSRGGDR
ncbi:hypothetical protein DTO164E3_2995 [Paecilomyces variotii]|nr:hypothetical protein DTO032I3_4594 [Paecilomyces variotii]KAJ9202555.1 hypothetical protein DTO164E3_2995 [Paecilomyces variotii]KAJ9283007.1 hypothetical protein DTO021D3_344 [Paecilomyces variotii]KAJ9343793.1 hypothetical protein DTO027B6_3618 [Paecilomyces variotii]KAJ9387005.1 hypothetical protein DTO032I4_3449 [Paecilomyces variotii]